MEKNNPKIELQKLWEKKDFMCTLICFGVAHVPSAHMERAGCMSYTADSHQVAIKIFAFSLGEL